MSPAGSAEGADPALGGAGSLVVWLPVLADWGRRRAAGAAHRLGVAWKAAGVAKGTAEQELDLGIGGAHLVGRPLRQGVVNGRVEPEKDAFAFCHELSGV